MYQIRISMKNVFGTNYKFIKWIKKMKESEKISKLMNDVGDLIRKHQKENNEELHHYWWAEMTRLVKQKKKVLKEEAKQMKEVSDYFA